MIKKLKVEDIVKILQVDDKIEDYFPCDKGEWVQWLIQRVDDPSLLILGNIIDDILCGYIIAANEVHPPLSNCIYVLFAHTAGKKINKEALNLLIDWAKEKKAKSIDFTTNHKNAVGLTVYGFKKKYSVMSMEL